MKKICFILISLLGLSHSALAEDNRMWNFRFSPLGALVGLVNAEVDYKIGPQMTVGPSIYLWNLKVTDIEVKSSGLGLQGRYFFDQVFSDGWYAVGQLGFSSTEASIRSNGVTYTGSASGLGLQLGGGYHWFWQSFNLNLGGLLGLVPATKIDLKDSNGNRYSESYSGRASFGAEFTIGWVF